MSFCEGESSCIAVPINIVWIYTRTTFFCCERYTRFEDRPHTFRSNVDPFFSSPPAEIFPKNRSIIEFSIWSPVFVRSSTKVANYIFPIFTKMSDCIGRSIKQICDNYRCRRDSFYWSSYLNEPSRSIWYRFECCYNSTGANAHGCTDGDE